MKFLVYGLGFLLTAIVLTIISSTGFVLGGLPTVVIFGLGVYVLPKIILRRIRRNSPEEYETDNYVLEQNDAAVADSNVSDLSMSNSLTGGATEETPLASSTTTEEVATASNEIVKETTDEANIREQYRKEGAELKSRKKAALAEARARRNEERKVEKEQRPSDPTRIYKIVTVVLSCALLIAFSCAIWLFADRDDQYALGYEDGNNAGYALGKDDGYDDGYDSGFSAGYESGETVGYNGGYDAGEDVGFKTGYKSGYAEGYALSEYYYEAAGYALGWQDGLLWYVKRNSSVPLSVEDVIWVEEVGLKFNIACDIELEGAPPRTPTNIPAPDSVTN